MPKNRFLPALLLSFASLGCASAEPEPSVTRTDAEPGVLTIGSTAPALDVDHWFDLGSGRGGAEDEAEASASALTDFEEGKVYVVEFWATWCGPCIMAIPHVHDLQEQYRDKGVQVVSISSEDVETIEPFFEREVMRYDGPEEEPPAYGDLMSAYRVGADPDRSVSESYMEAAGQNGIPCAFLVGKTGQIEWIGHPMSIDSVLAAVVDDTWDREAFAEDFRLQQQMELKQREAMIALRSGDADRAREVLASMAELSDDPAFQRRVTRMIEQVEFSIFFNRLGDDPAADVESLQRLAGKFAGNIEAVNGIAWQIAQRSAGGKEISDEVIQLAIDLTEAEVQEGERDGSALDTIGHLYYEMGDLEKAIEYQRLALSDEKAPEEKELREQIEAFLKKLVEEQDTSSEAP